MALHPTLSELHFKKSVMKFLIDELNTGLGVSLFFEPLSNVPRDVSGNLLSSWVVVSFDDRSLETVSSAFVLFDIFTRGDSEGFESSKIVDKITEVFTNDDSTNGLVSIPYYNTTEVAEEVGPGEVPTVPPTLKPWVLIGGMIPLHRRTTGAIPGKDETLIRIVSYEIKWGAR
jgi:hypothetical protein